MSEAIAVLPTQPPQSSSSIAALAAALAKAQGEMAGAKKDAINPHFKSRYADLASVWDACRAALSKNGLAVVQRVFADPDGVGVRTTLMHASGEWIEEVLVVPVQQRSAQGFGSAITYARRYALQAMVGVAADDDDGNEASAPAGRPANADHEQPKHRAIAKDIAARMAPKSQPPLPLPDDFGAGDDLTVLTDAQLANRKAFLLKKTETKMTKEQLKDAQSKLDAVLAEEERRTPKTSQAPF